MQPVTLYPELDELNTSFKPFFELTTMAYNVKTDLNEWTNNQLMRQDPNLIKSSVATWGGACMKLYKNLNEDYPEVSQCA
jgi:hypothetical protein